MCNWRDADHRGGAHSVIADRLGRGKGIDSLTSFCILGGKSVSRVWQSATIPGTQTQEARVFIRYYKEETL